MSVQFVSVHVPDLCGCRCVCSKALGVALRVCVFPWLCFVCKCARLFPCPRISPQPAFVRASMFPP